MPVIAEMVGISRSEREEDAPVSCRRGWTFPELIAVILLVAVVILIGVLSVGRGKATADELACQDNIEAIRSALEVYWTKNARTYPADQAAFEQFLQDRAYFTEEPRCPLDDSGAFHYIYTYDPATSPGPEGITISCPVSGSGH
ncbi:MAG: type II secretion system protein [Armatimonadota bacterium]|nr:MAG: type II secretion system protein [Armatimonadota bacterium]